MSNEPRMFQSVTNGDLPSVSDASVEASVEPFKEIRHRTLEELSSPEFHDAAQNIIDFAEKKNGERNEIATEGGHWYLPDGSPFYTVPRKTRGKNGEPVGSPRAVSLRFDRKTLLSLNAVPSVTTITSILDKPGLNRYRERQIFDACERLPRNGCTSEEFWPRVKAEAEEHSRKARERGTSLHAAIEQFLRREPVRDKAWTPHIANIVYALWQYGIDVRAGAAEKSFAHRLGFGGKVDWHTNGLPGDEHAIEILPAVMDFKSKEAIDDSKLKEWAGPEKAMQLAAYAEGLGLDCARGINVFVGENDAEVRIWEWRASDLCEAWVKFYLLLQYWKRDRHYYPKL